MKLIVVSETTRPVRILKAIQVRWKRWAVNMSLWRFSKMINRHAFKPNKRTEYDQEENQKPVIFFNASTRLVGVSQNAAFSLLSAAGLQLAGVPVVYFSCQAGMSQCVLGTRLDDLSAKPPCKSCMAQSNWLFAHAPTVGFRYQENTELFRQYLDLISRN